MQLKCLFGHDWSKNCEKCARCGGTRIGVHDWSQNCEKCARCGGTRAGAHDWSKSRERCSRCGNTRTMREALFNAVLSGDVGAVKALLTDEPGLASAVDSQGRTPLHIVARDGVEPLAETLIRARADPNARDCEGSTPLHIAAGNEQVGVAHLLISHGADVNARDNDGRSPLHTATYFGSEAVAGLLERNGGRLLTPCPDGSHSWKKENSTWRCSDCGKTYTKCTGCGKESSDLLPLCVQSPSGLHQAVLCGTCLDKAMKLA